MANVDCNEWRSWKNQHKDWPLTVHKNGQWVKRIRGRLHYFGVLDQPEEALRLFLEEKDFLLAGQEPPSRYEGLTVAELCDRHAADLEERIQAGKLGDRLLRNCRLAKRRLAAAHLANKPVDYLKPDDFSNLQRVIESEGLKLRSEQNVHAAIRSIFNWGVQMELCQRPKYGPRFVPPTLHEIEVERETAGRLRFFDRELLLKVLELADERMKVVVLLGVNAAFYPSDVEAVTLDHLHLDESIPYHDFRRVKTGRRRMCALWTETVQAIRNYVENARKPRIADERHLLVNQYGNPYARSSNSRGLAKLFEALVAKAGGQRPEGASVGSLRHVCATVLDLANDPQSVSLILGHTRGSIPGSRQRSLAMRVYSQLNLGELERLQAAADVVRRWLYHGELAGVPGDKTGAPETGMTTTIAAGHGFRVVG